MRHPYYIIKVLLAAAVIMAASACVKSDIEYVTTGSDISIAPVASVTTRSIPGAITGNVYPMRETMGIFAFHNEAAEPGIPWDNNATVNPHVYYMEPDGADEGTEPDNPHPDWAAEFGFSADKGAWGGIFSTLTDDKKSTEKVDMPHHWPDKGSLIFAGISPYYKFQAVDTEHLTMDGTLKPLKEMASFDVATRTLSVPGYTVGQYIPMTAEQIVNPDLEYVNESQTDAMFFMPQVKDGQYVGVNKLSAYPARFYHALSLIEFKVRAEDDYDMDRIEIDKIKLESVYHTGDFTAKVNNDGSISAEWTSLKSASNITVFGSDNDPEYLQLDLEPRSVAQVLLIPGPTHKIKVECHVFIKGQQYIQVFEVSPEDVGILKWEIGKRYVYNLIIGINKITFSPETYDWNDVRDAITVQ